MYVKFLTCGLQICVSTNLSSFSSTYSHWLWTKCCKQKTQSSPCPKVWVSEGSGPEVLQSRTGEGGSASDGGLWRHGVCMAQDSPHDQGCRERHHGGREAWFGAFLRKESGMDRGKEVFSRLSRGGGAGKPANQGGGPEQAFELERGKWPGYKRCRVTTGKSSLNFHTSQLPQPQNGKKDQALGHSQNSLIKTVSWGKGAQSWGIRTEADQEGPSLPASVWILPYRSQWEGFILT